ncbi:WD40-repeat-containing domain protein, partial [Suillus tomentosus]
AIAVSPDGQRMVTASWNIVRLWDMKKGVLLKRLEGHSSSFVNALSVSRDGQLIASGDDKGMLIAWDSNIGESLTQAIKAHSGGISSLAFSPGGSLLATGSEDGMIKLWCTKTWELLGNPTTFRQPGGHTATNKSYNNSLAWMPDGTRFFSAGSSKDPTIREWDTSTWMQVGDPWKGHFKSIRAISLNSNGTLLASASEDNRVRLWRISDRRTIVSFKHPCEVWCIAFSAD